MKPTTVSPETRKNAIHTVLPSILILFAMGVLFIANYLFTQQEPGGTDFLYRWLPTRLIVVEGYQNPYGADVEYQVELMHYGRAHQGNELPGIFAYPYFIIPLYIPFALIKDYALARALWMTLLECVVLLMVILTMRSFEFQIRKRTLIILFIFSLLFPVYTQPLVDGNPSPIAALFVLLSLIFIYKEKDVLGGILLGLSAIKPQLVILIFILFWFWAFSHKRWKIIAWSFLTVAILIGGSFAIQPSWFREFLQDLSLYPTIDVPYSPQTILDGWIPGAAKWIAWVLTAGVVILLGKEFIGVYKKGFFHLFWVVCLTFALAPLSGINSAHSTYIATLPGVVWVMAVLLKKWKTTPALVDVLLILSIIIGWVLFVVGRAFYWGNMQVYYLTFFLPPPLLAYAYYQLRQAYHEQPE